MAFRIREERRVAVAWFGEGSSARGGRPRGDELRYVRALPVVFVCDNNQWAYSTPTRLEYACEHVADRAEAYGFGGAVVDGTDVLAVYLEAKRAIEKAREGGGPTLLECVTLHGGPRCSRRRVLRATGAVRRVGERSRRALPDVAARARGAVRGRGRRDPFRRKAELEEGERAEAACR